MRLIVAALIPFFGCTFSFAAGTIPLEQVWSLGMPETRDARELDDNQEKPLVEEIRKAIKKPGPGFVVNGTDVEALVHADAVFAKNEKEENTFDGEGELTLVFYASPGARAIWINEVTRDGNTITIKHESIVQEASLVAPQFALIPLGKLPSGKYEVKIIQLPTMTPGGAAAPPNARVCKPFSFIVR